VYKISIARVRFALPGAEEIARHICMDTANHWKVIYLPTPEWVRETGTSRAKAQLGKRARSFISPGLQYGHWSAKSV